INRIWMTWVRLKICNLARLGLCSGGFCESLSAASKEVDHGSQGYSTRCPGPDSRYTAPDAHWPQPRRNSSSTQPCHQFDCLVDLASDAGARQWHFGAVRPGASLDQSGMARQVWHGA